MLLMCRLGLVLRQLGRQLVCSRFRVQALFRVSGLGFRRGVGFRG